MKNWRIYRLLYSRGPLATFMFLTAGSFLLPDPAFAIACENTRPSWDPADGPMSIWGETLHIMTGSGVIGLLIVMILAARFQNFWFTAIVTACAFGASCLYYNAWVSADPKSTLSASISEGCVGPPFGGIALLLIAAFVLFAWQLFGPKRQQS